MPTKGASRGAGCQRENGAAAGSRPAAEPKGGRAAAGDSETREGVARVPQGAKHRHSPWQELSRALSLKYPDKNME